MWLIVKALISAAVIVAVAEISALPILPISVCEPIAKTFESPWP